MSKTVKTAASITGEPWAADVLPCLACERVPQALRETHGSLNLMALTCSACQSSTPMMTQPADAILLWNTMQEGYMQTRLPLDFIEYMADGYSTIDMAMLANALRAVSKSLSLTVRIYRTFQNELDELRGQWQSDHIKPEGQ